MLAESIAPTVTGVDLRAMLAQTLRTEAKLLVDLVYALRQQRDAVSANSLPSVDAATFAMHRVLFTLAEARRVRHETCLMLGLPAVIPVHAIVDALARRCTVAIETACDEVLARADLAASELALNRQVLRGAIDVGDALVRVLAGISATSAKACAPRGALFNRNA